MQIEALEEALRKERSQREQSEAAAMNQMSALKEEFQIERGELGHRMADAEELASAYADENWAKVLAFLHQKCLLSYTKSACFLKAKVVSSEDQAVLICARR